MNKNLIDIPTLMSYDPRTSTVTIRHKKTKAILMMVKLETGGLGTMTRIDPTGQYDCDNYWIGIKPGDSEVFEGELFGPKKLVITKCIRSCN